MSSPLAPAWFIEGHKVVRVRPWHRRNPTTGQPLENVHHVNRCYGRTCIIHRPSRHAMHRWPLIWRADRNMFVRMCPHRMTHPDPDQFEYWRSAGRHFEMVHECDGCCTDLGVRAA